MIIGVWEINLLSLAIVECGGGLMIIKHLSIIIISFVFTQ